MNRAHLSAAVIGAMLAAGTAASAQTGDGISDAGKAAASKAETGFDDIVVTARRRAENVQDVPVAVTAFDGASLARKSVVRLEDLTKATPALQVVPSAFSQNTPRFTIRSQSQFEPLLTLDPSVAVYFADVVQSRAHGLNAAMFDLASVQVVKGPQGTLFGRNTTGGAVLLAPNAPSMDGIEGSLTVNAGNYDLFTYEGVINLPITDRLAIRFAHQIVRRDGYSLNRATGERKDDQHNESWRLSVLYDSQSGFRNTLFLNGFSAKENGTAFKLTGATPAGLFATAYPTVPALLAAEKAAPFHSFVSAQTGTGAVVSTFGIENTTEVELGAVTLKNIFGYREVDSVSRFDFDGTTFQMFDSRESLDSNQFSNELQLLGKALDDRLDWIVGGYYFREKGVNSQGGILSFPGFFEQRTLDVGHVKNSSVSAFAQANYKLPFLEGLSVTAGGRLTRDKRELTGSGTNFGICNRTDLSGVPLSPCERHVEKSFKEPTYTFGLDYQISPHHLVYIAHRRGYRSGGFNLRARTPQEFTPFSPEIVKDVELGLKADWRIGGTSLRTNFALYRQKYDDIQRVQAVVINGVLVTTIVNAAKATVKGFEADATWLLGDNVEVRGFYSYSDPVYDNWVARGVDLSNNKFSYAPKHSAGGSLRITQPLPGDNGSISVMGDVYYQSRIQLQDVNVVPDGVEGGYATANARLEWNNVLGTKTSAALWVRNLTDTKYFTSGVPIAAFGSTVKTIGAPRTWGVELKYNFGKLTGTSIRE